MATKKKPAREVAQLRGGGEVWIDHAEIVGADAEWMRDAQWLTLWNVTTPPGFLATLPELWAVDLRGGSATDLAVIEGCVGLRCLIVNQVRGLRDLSLLSSLTSIEFLSLYGLKQVESAPSLSALSALRRLEVGQMRGLATIGPLLEAPAIEEIYLHKWVNATGDDVARLKASPTLRTFDWWGVDIPISRWLPIVTDVGLPKTKPIMPRDWFALA